MAAPCVANASSEAWWSQTDSNRRHPACKAGALPTELWPPLRLKATLYVKNTFFISLKNLLYTIVRSSSSISCPMLRLLGYAGDLPGIARQGDAGSTSLLPSDSYSDAKLLLRKEVIQPQVPLRLPCYDFVPITSPTLGCCLPERLAHILRAEPAFMT